MEDVNISKYRASVVREGSKPASPGFVVSEGQSPTDPAGTGQNHLPVTIAAASTGLSITESQILSGAGTVSQYIRGDGSLADFPEASGGGSSVSYYLNGSVNQGTIGGVAYKELNKVPILGAGTDFTINADGYIASFITDAGDPNLLEIPGGNWNFETYFSANSGGGSPTFYVELYKYNGTTFTLLASNSGSPELIAFGTNIISYFSTLAVPTTALALTDRLAIRYYVTHSGRTITLHTEDNHLCQIITTFTTGITALNGLTAQVQNFAVGTSGTDFAISSATATHTFNLPTASATNRGALSSADWSTFNAKQNALTNPVTGTGTNNYLPKFTGLTTIGDSVIADNTNEVNISKRIFLNSGGQSIFFTPNLSGVSNRIEGSSGIPLEIFTGGSALRLGAGGSSTQINLASTGVVTMSNLAGTGSRIVVADSSGNLSASSALSGYVQGSGTTNYLPKFTAASTIGNSAITDDGTNLNLISRSIIIANSGLTAAYIGATSSQGFLNLYSGTSSGYNNGASITLVSSDRSGAFTRGELYIEAGNASNNTANGFIQMLTGNSPRVTITYGGNLLVGTTTDNGARLQVSGEGRFYQPLTNTTSYLTIENNRARNAAVRLKTTVGDYYIGTGIGADVNQFQLYDATSGETRILVNSSGNVGIATTNNVDARLNIQRPNDSGTLIRIGNADLNYFDFARSQTTGALSIQGNQTGFNNIILAPTSGNVGIGTTSPDTYSYGGTRKFLTFTATATNEEPFLQLIANGVGNSIIDFGNATIRRATIIGFDGSHLAFYTNGSNSGTGVSERMRITSSGNVLIGTTTDGGNGILQVNKSTSNAVARFTNARNTSGDFGIVTDLGSNCNNTSSYHYIAGTGGADKFYLYGNGTYATVSDRRLKKNIESVTEQFLEKVLALDIVTYNWNDQKDGSDLELGMIAQQVETSFPSIVKTNRPDLSGQTYKSIQASALPYILIKAIQELKQEIDTLKN